MSINTYLLMGILIILAMIHDRLRSINKKLN